MSYGTHYFFQFFSKNGTHYWQENLGHSRHFPTDFLSVLFFSLIVPYLLKQDLNLTQENLKKKSVVYNKEYCSLDKMTEKEICFSKGKVWKEHKSLLLPAGFQPGLCPAPVFLLSLTVLIFSVFDLLSAVISLVFTFTITHLNLIKFKTLNACSFPRFTVLLPPTPASSLGLIESSFTKAMGDQQRASGPWGLGPWGLLAPCQLFQLKQTLVASFS